MSNNYFFKAIGQRSVGNKIILVAAVTPEVLGLVDPPNIFELQCYKQPPSIYTGTYPCLRVIPESLKDRGDLKGMGIAGIITDESWYCAARPAHDAFGIHLPEQDVHTPAPASPPKTMASFKADLARLLEEYDAAIGCGLDGDTHCLSTKMYLEVGKQTENVTIETEITHYHLIRKP